MERTQFIVLESVENNVDFNTLVMTSHWQTERIERHQKIMEIIGGGKLVASFEVDTAHPNGNEIHNIFSNGIILIQNKDTRKLITELIARPSQIRRYWGGFPPAIINGVIEKARNHQRNGYNYW